MNRKLMSLVANAQKRDSPQKARLDETERAYNELRAEWFEREGSIDGFHEAVPEAKRLFDLAHEAHALEHGAQSMGGKGLEASEEVLRRDMAVFRLALPVDLREAFRAACEASGESMSSVLRSLIRKYLEAP